MRKDTLHLKAPDNWINDPNGFIYYRGKYHLFYQYFPYAPMWGTMHWGHSVSDDLVSWEHKGIALFPTKYYDRNGVFSGSAVEKDGKLMLYYSAVRYLEQEEENIHVSKNWQFETSQAMMISQDGETFDNWNGKRQIIPVIRDESIADAKDTRDPKVWQENGRYYMVLGSTEGGHTGRVVIYTSDDALNWEFLTNCANEHYGTIIECPDLFSVDGEHVFICSPIGIQQDGKEYANHSVCSFVDWNPEEGRISLANDYMRVDYGGDLYAPQTNVDKDGRRVLIAWMRMPQVIENPEAASGSKEWIGMMCLPRVVSVRDGHICFAVHPNVEKYFQKDADIQDVVTSDSPFRIETHLSEGDSVSVGQYRIWLENGCLCTDRSHNFPDVERYHGVSRTPELPDVQAGVKVDIYVSPHLVEIFVDDGYYVVSNVVYNLDRNVSGKVESIKILS